MRTTVRLLLILALTGSTSGCLAARDVGYHITKEALGRFFGASPVNPNIEIQTVAVVELLRQGEADDTPNMVKYANIFATELVRSGTFRKVIRPDQVLRVMHENKIPAIRDANDVREVGRLLNVDGVFVGAITDFNPYYPPRIGFAMQLYRTDNSVLAAVDLETLSQAGKPIHLSTDTRDYPLLGGEWIFDIRDNLMENEFERYALARQGGDRPRPVERLARETDEYFRFVCFRTIVYLMDQEEERQEKMKNALTGR